MQKLHEAHLVELALLVALAVAWAVLTLARAVLAPTVALLLTVADRGPAAPAPEPTPATPLQHPLARLAAELEALPQRQLMTLAGTRRRLQKRQLTEMVLAMV